MKKTLIILLKSLGVIAIAKAQVTYELVSEYTIIKLVNVAGILRSAYYYWAGKIIFMAINLQEET